MLLRLIPNCLTSMCHIVNPSFPLAISVLLLFGQSGESPHRTIEYMRTAYIPANSLYNDLLCKQLQSADALNRHCLQTMMFLFWYVIVLNLLTRCRDRTDHHGKRFINSTLHYTTNSIWIKISNDFFTNSPQYNKGNTGWARLIRNSTLFKVFMKSFLIISCLKCTVNSFSI